MKRTNGRMSDIRNSFFFAFFRTFAQRTVHMFIIARNASIVSAAKLTKKAKDEKEKRLTESHNLGA